MYYRPRTNQQTVAGPEPAPNAPRPATPRPMPVVPGLSIGGSAAVPASPASTPPASVAPLTAPVAPPPPAAIDPDDALTKVMGRNSDGAAQKLAGWTTYLPVVVASLIAFSSLVSTCLYLAFRINQPPTNGTQSFMYFILIGIPAIQAFASIRYLYTGSTTCRKVLAFFLIIGILGTIALAAINGLVAAITPFLINVAMLVGLYLPGADLYAPGGTVKMKVVHGVGIPCISGGGLVGLGIIFGLSVFGSPAVRAEKLDAESERYLSEIFAMGGGSDGFDANSPLAQRKNEVFKKLVEMEQEAKYLMQCGERVHGVRALCRLRYAFVYVAHVTESRPQILQDRIRELFEACTRLLDEVAAQHPEVRDEAFNQMVEDALLLCKAMSISV